MGYIKNMILEVITITVLVILVIALSIVHTATLPIVYLYNKITDSNFSIMDYYDRVASKILD